MDADHGRNPSPVRRWRLSHLAPRLREVSFSTPANFVPRARGALVSPASPTRHCAMLPELQDLLTLGVNARRRHRPDEARATFLHFREAAREADAAAEVAAADAHLALLADDRPAAEQAVARLVALEPCSPAAAALGMLMAEQWPAPERPRETHLVGRSAAFRRFCRKLPGPEEIALELGASHGLATRMLARHARHVYAVEKSPEMARRARTITDALPNVTLIEVDAREPGLVRAHVPAADLIFVDIGARRPSARFSIPRGSTVRCTARASWSSAP